MRNRLLYLAFIVTGLLLLTVGCASQGTPPPGGATAAPAAPTVAATAPATTSANGAAPATTGASSSDTIRLDLVSSKSQARYVVREQLASLSFPSDAIGKTGSITGTIVGKTDGSIVSSDSKFVVDLRTLQSDRSQRDNFLRRAVLQTEQYPYATFVPTSAPGLPLQLPADGKVSFKLNGNLTIKNVTKPVTWDVSGQVNGNEATGTATTSFNFAYFNLERPTVAIVLSIEDNIRLEMDLDLQRVQD